MIEISKSKILVTGADGFIGSHLTEELLKSGAKVRALSLYNSFNNWGWLEDVPSNKNLEIVTGDIRDPHFCKTITKDIDIVFHLAALIKSLRAFDTQFTIDRGLEITHEWFKNYKASIYNK